MSKRLKQADTQSCNAIIDYKERKVIKCVIEGKVVDTDFERLSDYYKKIYPVIVSQLERENSPKVEQSQESTSEKSEGA